MLGPCRRCGAILEYDPETGCIECPKEKYDKVWAEADYAVLGWEKSMASPAGYDCPRMGKSNLNKEVYNDT